MKPTTTYTTPAPPQYVQRVMRFAITCIVLFTAIAPWLAVRIVGWIAGTDLVESAVIVALLSASAFGFLAMARLCREGQAFVLARWKAEYDKAQHQVAVTEGTLSRLLATQSVPFPRNAGTYLVAHPARRLSMAVAIYAGGATLQLVAYQRQPGPDMPYPHRDGNRYHGPLSDADVAKVGLALVKEAVKATN